MTLEGLRSRCVMLSCLGLGARGGGVGLVVLGGEGGSGRVGGGEGEVSGSAGEGSAGRRHRVRARQPIEGLPQYMT